MTEFKVNKLGWYEDEKGRKYELLKKVTDRNNSRTRLIVIHLDYSQEVFELDENGELWDYQPLGDKPNLIIKLIKYLGPELPREPRKFEFEAELGESNEKTDNSSGIMRAIDKVLGHYCSNLVEKIQFPEKYNKVSKWHLTMEEIIE